MGQAMTKEEHAAKKGEKSAVYEESVKKFISPAIFGGSPQDEVSLELQKSNFAK